MILPNEFIEERYRVALERTVANNFQICNNSLPEHIRKHIDVVLEKSESSKAVMTVLVTSIVYKLLNPCQDIRLHQYGMIGGYSGRTFDSKYITPFLTRNKFPHMAESGWLTRSLEQKVPYNLDFPGAITPSVLKVAFLQILNEVEKNGADCEMILDYIFQGLIIRREQNEFDLAKPQNLSIAEIMSLLSSHFNYRYKSAGASRLPVLALYAIYQALILQLKRYDGKILLPLECHTSADVRSGRLGDIDIVDAEENAFESVEVKFDRQITHNMVEVAKEKIVSTTVNRYYILSTLGIAEEDKEIIVSDIQQIKNTHGCQLVINGVMPTIKYYLRLLEDSAVFVANYAKLLKTDSALKSEHKLTWNLLVSKL